MALYLAVIGPSAEGVKGRVKAVTPSLQLVKTKLEPLA